MPTINLRERKRKRVKTRAMVRAQDIYQDKRWKSLRAYVILTEPLCRRCKDEMQEIRLAEEVHHRIPFTSGTSPAQVERLAFDHENCEPLCIECHKARHRELNR